MQTIKRIEIFKKHMMRFLENLEIDHDEEWYNQPSALTELKNLVETNSLYISNSIQMTLETEEPFLFGAVRNFHADDVPKIKQQMADLAKQFPSAKKLRAVFFIDNLRTRAAMETEFSKDFQNDLRSQARNKGLRLHCAYILEHTYKNEEAAIGHIRRYEILQKPSVSFSINMEASPSPAACPPASPCSLVFSADLRELINLYDLIGDRLFKNNVRFGIHEVLGVDQAIRETLETEPELFWYKNNGITILVETPDFQPRFTEHLVLDRLAPDQEPGFSVINGAQSITTAAQYWFKQEYLAEHGANDDIKSSARKILERAKNAQVLVRVIHIPKDTLPCNGLITPQTGKEISIALNRQKPIKIEDIAFTSAYVEKLSSYLERRNKETAVGNYTSAPNIFYLTRRGEELASEKQMDLVQFARARLACAGMPGNARSDTTSNILRTKIEDDVLVFKDQEIFPNQWMEAYPEEEDAVFRRYYGAILTAHTIAGLYQSKKKIANMDPDTLSVIGNGRWHFVSFVVQMMNGFREFSEDGKTNQPDYTDFSWFPDTSSLKLMMDDGILLFAQMTVQFLRLNKKDLSIDSNLFKKQTRQKNWFTDMVAEMKQRNRSEKTTDAEELHLRELMNSFAKLFSDSSSDGTASLDLPSASSAASAAAAFSPDDSEAAITQENAYSHYVVLGTEKIGCASAAQALQLSTEYILNHYPISENDLELHFHRWITNTEKAKEKGGYFRTLSEPFMAGERQYRLGTSSNQERKNRQLQELCEFAKVPANTIFLYQSEEKEPFFSW